MKTQEEMSNIEYTRCMIDRYGLSIKEFHQENRGTLFDWMITLDFKDLEIFHSSEKSGEENHDLISCLSMISYCLSEGLDKNYDENRVKETADIVKITGTFIFLSAAATLQKANIINFKFDDSKFLNSDPVCANINMPSEGYQYKYLELFKKVMQVLYNIRLKNNYHIPNPGKMVEGKNNHD